MSVQSNQIKKHNYQVLNSEVIKTSHPLKKQQQEVGNDEKP